MTERNDTSKISPTNPEYDVANVDDRILNYTKQIRKNMFTDNITEAMARVAELAGLIAGESSDTAKYVKEANCAVSEKNTKTRAAHRVALLLCPGKEREK